jgi:hypothetical protein
MWLYLLLPEVRSAQRLRARVPQLLLWFGSLLAVCTSLGARPARAEVAASAASSALSPTPPDTTWVPFDLTLVPPLNIFHPERKGIAGLAINLLWGTTDELLGAQVGTLYNRVTDVGAGLN